MNFSLPPPETKNKVKGKKKRSSLTFTLISSLNATNQYSVTVGSQALPTILKMSSIMKEAKASWSEQNELPVEIPLSKGLNFHSIFTCPVSREVGVEDNPPMMLPCGHILCKVSLEKLTQGGK